MYRYTATYIGQDGGELKPPAEGWIFVSCALDPDSDKLVVVWQNQFIWPSKNETATIELQRVGEEPV